MSQPTHHLLTAERLNGLRRAHQVLAQELSATQRRLHQRERELRELQAALGAYRGLRASQRTSYS